MEYAPSSSSRKRDSLSHVSFPSRSRSVKRDDEGEKVWQTKNFDFISPTKIVFFSLPAPRTSAVKVIRPDGHLMMMIAQEQDARRRGRRQKQQRNPIVSTRAKSLAVAVPPKYQTFLRAAFRESTFKWPQFGNVPASCGQRDAGERRNHFSAKLEDEDEKKSNHLAADLQ